MKLKSKEEIEIMKKGGRLTEKIIDDLLSRAVPGTSLIELDRRAEEMIISFGATPSFKTVKGYQFSTCLNVNDGVVHGIPSTYVLREGDIFSVDLGVCYEGMHTDAAWTSFVGAAPPKEVENFLSVGREALERGIAAAEVGNSIKDISQEIQRKIEGAGFCVSRDLVGHGIGYDLHEEPQVPGFLEPGSGHELLREGLVLAIEVIYMKGKSPVVRDPIDRWTISTEDGSIAALFEDTVAITSTGPVVITRSDENLRQL